MDGREDIDMCFLDFSEELDFVNYHLICIKLAALRMPPLVGSWIGI